MPRQGGASTPVAGDGADESISERQVPLVKSAREKIGRNEPCWCGSGRKYKLCHGAR